MGKYKFIGVLIAIFTFGVLVVAGDANGLEEQIDAQSSKLNAISAPILVAEVDGKYYFAGNHIGKNWTEALEYCISWNMKLSTITSENQWTALVSAFHRFDFVNGYWIAGRDSQELRQFNWDETNSEITGSFIRFKSWIPVQYQTCLMFNSQANNESYLFYYPCDLLTRPLCEA